MKNLNRVGLHNLSLIIYGSRNSSQRSCFSTLQILQQTTAYVFAQCVSMHGEEGNVQSRIRFKFCWLQNGWFTSTDAHSTNDRRGCESDDHLWTVRASTPAVNCQKIDNTRPSLTIHLLHVYMSSSAVGRPHWSCIVTCNFILILV